MSRRDSDLQWLDSAVELDRALHSMSQRAFPAMPVEHFQMQMEVFDRMRKTICGEPIMDLPIKPVNALRRIARWEGLCPLWEAREHSDATCWYELHRNDNSGEYFLSMDYMVPQRLDAMTTVDAIGEALLNWIMPARSRMPYDVRIERVV